MQMSVIIVLMTHIFACLWFLTANLSDFSPDTWVSRKNLQNSPPDVQYLYALYWASQTVTTVGYGDIPAVTSTEIGFSYLWMLFGVIFYSFTIGNFASIIASEGENAEKMTARI
jgi:hypothetical protein